VIFVFSGRLTLTMSVIAYFEMSKYKLHSLREEVAVLTVASLAWTRLLAGEIGEQQDTKKRSRRGKVAVRSLNNKRSSLSFQTLPLPFVLSCYLQSD